MPLQIKPSKIEEHFTNTNPFQRELIRKELSLYKKNMYKRIEEGFLYGVGGIMHFWLWHAVLSSKSIPLGYFVVLSTARWMKEQQGKDTFKARDLLICGISIRQIELWINVGLKKTHIARHRSTYGKFKITHAGNCYITYITNKMYKVVVDLYDPSTKKDLKI